MCYIHCNWCVMEKDLHGGHRKRLREKVKKVGLKGFMDHEILELLLTYAIPRKDTNKLGHKILNYFNGSLTKAIDADYKTLSNIEGVGENTALFFNVLSELIDVYLQRRSKKSLYTLQTTKDCVEYFRDNYAVKDEEMFVIVTLSNTNKIINTISVDGKTDNEVKIDAKEVFNKIDLKNVASVVIYHTHPSGDVKPSLSDLKATVDFNYICKSLDIKLVEHLIMNEVTQFSFKSAKLLDAMQKVTSLKALETLAKEYLRD